MRLLRLAKTVPLLLDQFFRSRTELSDAGISVREHASCQGNHHLQYESCRWVLREDRYSAAYKGFSANGICADTHEIRGKPLLAASESQSANEQLLKSEALPASATRSIVFSVQNRITSLTLQVPNHL